MIEKTCGENCCGCRACEQICPLNAIHFAENSRGFIFPQIDRSKCVDCGKCDDICPMLHHQHLFNKEEQVCFGGIHQSQEALLKSSSGGAFQSICSTFDDKTVIFGAVFGKNLTVEHKNVFLRDGIVPFQKSKYVQSDTLNSYQKAEQLLKNKETVLYSGTPCQIAGLRNYLKTEYENLFTVDLVCHGVPNFRVFRSYLDSLAKKYHLSDISAYSFREKKKFLDDWEIDVSFGDDKKHKNLAWGQDSYMFGFLRKLYYRPSCYVCPFANQDAKRVSDITIGDFWGCKKVIGLDEKKGCSLLIANTIKGKTTAEKMKSSMTLKEVSLASIVEQNQNLITPSSKHSSYEDFFTHFEAGEEFHKIMKKYIKKKSRPQIIRVLGKKILLRR